MTTNAAFIDLPNMYSGLIRSKLADPKSLRSYFLYWLDLDLLVKDAAYFSTNIWVFYSNRIGPSNVRISDDYLKKYVSKINMLDGVTARDVNIPGEQREPAVCSACGREGLDPKSEKGIDASLIVHLFDTMDSWETAYLFSGDADYVPVVTSLRRRGKIVIGVGFQDASSALVRECYSYIDLVGNFLRVDIALYSLLKDDGILAKWLEAVEPDSVIAPGTLKIRIFYMVYANGPDNTVHIEIQGSCDVESLRKDLLNHIGNDRLNIGVYDHDQKKVFIVRINTAHRLGLQRRINNLLTSVQGRRKISDSSGQTLGYQIEYQYNYDKKKYECLEDQRDPKLAVL